MATTATILYRGAASVSPTTLYTVPSSTTAVVTNIVVANTTGSTATFTITLNGTDILSSVSLAANSSAFFDLKQVLTTGQILSGSASATSVNFSISGVQIV